MTRSNNQRKKELRQLHTAGRLTYVEERHDPELARKVWEGHVNGRTILLTTATVDGFLMAARRWPRTRTRRRSGWEPDTLNPHPLHTEESPCTTTTYRPGHRW